MKTTITALALLASLATQAAPLSNAAADTLPPREAFSDTHHGVKVDDPYRWMEQPARANDLAAWIKASSAHTVAELGELPERAGFAATLETTTRAGVRYADVQSAGETLFFRRLDPADRFPKLVVRRQGVERVLLDPAAGTKEVIAIGNYSVSPDGRTVAVHVSKGGGETGETRFLDVASGRQVGTPLSPIWSEFTVGWLDNHEVTYTHLTAANGADPMQNMQAAVTTVGHDGGTVVLGNTLAGGPSFEPQEFPLISGGRHQQAGAASEPLHPWRLGIRGII